MPWYENKGLCSAYLGGVWESHEWPGWLEFMGLFRG